MPRLKQDFKFPVVKNFNKLFQFNIVTSPHNQNCGGRCGREHGVSGEVCWRVGKGCGEKNGGGVGKCVRVWGPNTLPHISLPSPFPTSPLTPTHFPTPPLIPLPTSPLLPPTSQQVPTHFPTSPLTFSKCGEVTM